MWSKVRKHPLFWHLIAVLVASGLETLLTAAYKLQLLKRDSFWLATGFLAVALLIIFQLWLYYWNRRRPVFILITPFHNNYFFTGLLQGLIEELRVRNLVGVPISHATGCGSAGQNRDFNQILHHKHDYVGGIVAGLEPGVGAEEIKRFLTAFAKPVVFLDAAPFERETNYPPATAFVGFDDEAGGRKAAEALLNATAPASATPRILVIGGNLKRGRQSAFRSQATTAFPGAVVTVNEDGRFLREEARRIAEHYFEACNDQKYYDGVFCTNDEMALGVLDALPTLPQRVPKQPLVVGYDAIPEAVRAIEKGTQLRNTVMQDSRELAQRGAEFIANSLEGSSNLYPKITLLQPVIYRKFDSGPTSG